MPTQFAWERKKIPLSRLKVGLAVGFLLVALIAAGTSYADGQFGSGPAPLSTLVKFGDREYELTTADWVSLDPISSSTVRKIGYGRITEVSIATTSTGTYSSDGMVSPHVRYPGITVRAVPLDESAEPIWKPIGGARIYTLGSIPSAVRIIDVQ